MEQNDGSMSSDDGIEIPTVKGFYHSILRFGYILAEDHIEKNIAQYGLPQENFEPPSLALVSTK